MHYSVVYDLMTVYSKKTPVQSPTQFFDPISYYRKPVERTNEIAYPLVSLVRFPGFP